MANYTYFNPDWEDSPDTTTPITAAALEHIETGIVDVDAKVDQHAADTTAAHAASAVAFTPVGTIAATNVQAAITEVAAEAGAGAGSTLQYALIGDTVVGATSLIMERNAASPLAVGSRILISGYSTRAELKTVTSVSSATIGFTATKTAHTSGDMILVITGPMHVSPFMYGCTLTAVDNWGPLQRCILETTANACKMIHTDGLSSAGIQVAQPVVVPTSSQWEDIGVATLASYSPVSDPLGGVVMVTTRGPYAFTATAVDNVVTVPEGHGLPVGWPAANVTLMVFNTPYGGTLPGGITAGKVYYALTSPTATTMTISTTFNGTELNITSDGSGYTCTQMGALSRIYWDKIRINLSVANVQGLIVDMQQPAYLRNLRIEMDVAATTEGTVYGAIVGGQIGYVDNVEINPSAKCRAMKLKGSGMVVRGFNCNGVNNADTGIELVAADNPSIWDPWTEQCGNAGILITSGRGIFIGGSWLQAVSNTTSPALKVVDAQAPYEVGQIRVPGTGYKLIEDTARGITLGATSYTDAAGVATDYQSVFMGLVQPGTNFGTLQVHAPRLKGRVSIPVTADYIVRYLDETMFVNSTAANRTLSLPVAAGWAGTEYRVYHSSGANTCTIGTAGAETIDGAASITVPAGGCTVVVSDGTNYQIRSERA